MPCCIKIKALDELDEEIMDQQVQPYQKCTLCASTDNTVDEVYFRKSVLALLKKLASQFGEKVDSDWLQSFELIRCCCKIQKTDRTDKGRASASFLNLIRSRTEL